MKSNNIYLLVVCLASLIICSCVLEEDEQTFPDKTTKAALVELNVLTKNNAIGKVSALLKLREFEVSGKVIVSTAEYKMILINLSKSKHKTEISTYVAVSQLLNRNKL